jgi:hypothetical protein
MSNEYDNDNEQGESGFLDHLFNALGHLARHKRNSSSASEAGDGKPRKRIKSNAFDEAPAPAKDDCCVVKR